MSDVRDRLPSELPEGAFEPGDDERAALAELDRQLDLLARHVPLTDAEIAAMLADAFAELDGVRREADLELDGLAGWDSADVLPQPAASPAADPQPDSQPDPVAEVHAFFAERVTFEPGAKVARQDLRAAYLEWCAERGAEPLAARCFASALRSHGVTDGATMRRLGRPVDAWRGVRLLTEAKRVEQPEREPTDERDDETENE
jgi:hypothetical protein